MDGSAELTVRVRVPATSANLGPGFDAFALALDLCDEVEVAVLPSPGGNQRVTQLLVEGEGVLDLPRDDSHLVVRAFDATLAQVGAERPSLRLRARNRIPHGRGLGSSAAAIVAGVVLGRSVAAGLAGDDPLDLLDDAGALALASELEGHPDNVAACLLGGFTVAWTDVPGPHSAVGPSAAAGRARAVRLDPSPGLAPVVLVPRETLPTSAARALLPDSVPHADAVHAAGRAGLLVAALTQRPDLLLAATEDRLHQHYRALAMPATLALVDALRAEDVPAVVSGAGPGVLALVDAAGADRLVEEAPDGWTPLALRVAEGARIVAP